MKHFLLVVAAAAMMMTGCNAEVGEDTTWDFVNASVAFTLLDNDDTDLLNPDTENKYDLSKVVVTYADKEYRYAQKTVDEAPTRTNMPRTLALRLEQVTYQQSDIYGRFLLTFGEFSPESDYHDQTFTIDWGNGTTDRVTFSYYVTWKKNKPTVHSAISVNGKKRDTWLVENQF